MLFEVLEFENGFTRIRQIILQSIECNFLRILKLISSQNFLKHTIFQSKKFYF
jgi:hypothetical protein